MAAYLMKFKEPYSQYIGKWFENTKYTNVRYYILNIEKIKGSREKVKITRIETGRKNNIEDNWGEDWWLELVKPLDSDSKDAIRIIFK